MSDANSTAVFDNLRYARWLLGQGDNLKAVLAYCQAFRDAATPREKWTEGVNPAVLVLLDLYESLPTTSLEVVALADVESAYSAQGIDLELVQLLISQFLPLVLELIGRFRK